LVQRLWVLVGFQSFFAWVVHWKGIFVVFPFYCLKGRSLRHTHCLLGSPLPLFYLLGSCSGTLDSDCGGDVSFGRGRHSKIQNTGMMMTDKIGSTLEFGGVWWVGSLCGRGFCFHVGFGRGISNIRSDPAQFLAVGRPLFLRKTYTLLLPYFLFSVTMRLRMRLVTLGFSMLP